MRLREMAARPLVYSALCRNWVKVTAMLRDMRATELYSEISRFLKDVRQPGSGQISDTAHLDLSPDKGTIVFSATVADHVDREPPTRLALTNLTTGETSLVTEGPNNDQLPRFSRDGQRIAFLSDRHQAGKFQLHILDLSHATIKPTARISGHVEHLQWSPDGSRILLRVVGPKEHALADGKDLPSWLPLVEPTDAHDQWRSCWVYDIATDTACRLSIDGGAVWEATWCGDESLVAVVSDKPGENAWYLARLCDFDLVTGRLRTIYLPQDQLGPPVVSPKGKTIAAVEGLCSDRGPVIGDLRLIDCVSGHCRTAHTGDVDVVKAEWCSEHLLLLSGYRGLATVIGLYDVMADQFREVWASQDVSITASCVSALEKAGDCVIIVEGFQAAPELASIRGGQYRRIKSFDIGYDAAVAALASVERLTWPSADGLMIEGWLLRPHGPSPYPTVVTIHGGPVAHWRPSFMVRRLLHVPILVRRGYAVFMPNPRGGSGRGQAFTRRVLGDLGGGDALDILSGVHELIESGVADPQRIGVTGVSYGGFMSAWLISQSERFAAAVAVSPHTNQVTAHLLSNIPTFMSHLLGDDIGNVGGRYFERSPVLRAAHVSTPTLTIGGALDRGTPVAEAIQFHNALREAGVESALAVYPLEGHGVRRLPAAIDCNARIIDWLTDHLAVERRPD